MNSHRNRFATAVAGLVVVGAAGIVAGCGGSDEDAAGIRLKPAEPAAQEGPSASPRQPPATAPVSQATAEADIERARSVALEEAGGGEAVSVERDEDGGYDVEIVQEEVQVSVELGSDFGVTGVETEERVQAPRADAEQARSVALDEAGGGEVISVEADDDGGYDVEIIDGDQEISVELDPGFRVVGVESEQIGS